MSRRARVAALAALVLAAACEPRGPGALIATIRAPVPIGAVVVELAGARVMAFEGLGSARTFAAEGAPGDTVQRVIVVSPTAGTLRFRLEVEDIAAEPPRAAVVDAVDPANRPIAALDGFAVRISR